MRIYLTDDDEVSNFLFRSTVNLIGSSHDLRTFLTAGDVLKDLHENGFNGYPDALFVDLSMPVMDGWELLDELQKRHPYLINKCKIYILTSSIRTSDEVRGTAHPLVAGFLSKPVKKDLIKQILFYS